MASFGVTRALIRRLAPPNQNLVFELLLAQSRRGWLGLHDRTLAFCCAASLATVFHFAMLPWVLALLGALLLALMLPVFRFGRLMVRNAWAEDLLITPMPSRDYARGFSRFFLVAVAFVFIPYFVFMYLGYFCGLQWRGMAGFYETSGMMTLLGIHVFAGLLLVGLFWSLVAGRPYSLFWLGPFALIVYALVLEPLVMPGGFYPARYLLECLWGAVDFDFLRWYRRPYSYRYYASLTPMPFAFLFLCTPFIILGGLMGYAAVRARYVRQQCRRLFP